MRGIESCCGEVPFTVTITPTQGLILRPRRGHQPRPTTPREAQEPPDPNAGNCF